MLLVVIAALAAMRELWKRNQELGVQYREYVDAESAKRKVMRDAHEAQIRDLRDEMERRTAEYIEHLNGLQEKRINAEVSRTREVMELAAEIRSATRQQTDALTFLRDTVARRDP
jgi:hypothetical protein